MNFVGFDIETTDSSPWEGEILSVALEPWVWLTKHHPDGPDYEVINTHPQDSVLCGHNLFFDLQWWLHKYGELPGHRYWDTMVAQSLIDENTHPNTLEALAIQYLGEENVEYDPDAKEKRKHLVNEPGDYVRKYNLLDAEYSSKVAWMQHQLMSEDERVLMSHLMGTLLTLVRMTVRGVRIDTDKARLTLGKLHSRREELERDLSKHILRLEEHDAAYDGDLPTGEYLLPANLASPQQLVEALYQHLALPVVERSQKTQAPSTSSPALKKAAAFLPADDERRRIITDFLEWRECKKLVGTYIEPFLTTHVRHDGRVHGRYSMAKGPFGGTVTGRLSSREPNLQNIPRDERIKSLFVPSPGMHLFEADYAQLEMRVAGYYSQDPKLLAIFRDGRDIHTGVLSDLWERDYDELVGLLGEGDPVWKERRAAVKQVNFSILYGAAPPKVRELLGLLGVQMEEAEVKKIMARWRETYSGFAQWEAGVKYLVERDRELVTPLGRVRHLQEEGLQRAFRQGVNFLIQSFASDFVTLGLPLVEREISSTANLLLTVHDSIIGEYDPDVATTMPLEDAVKKAMTTDLLYLLEDQFDVDTEGLYLSVDVETGKSNWYA